MSKLADRLITAHSETAEWLMTVLAQDAVGEPAAHQPAPLQTVAAATAVERRLDRADAPGR